MRKFNDIKAQYQYPEMVQLQYEFYAYKDGKAHGPFNNIIEAHKVSANTERVQKNKKEYEDYQEQYRQIEGRVVDEWFIELREYYKDLNDKTFNVCYNMAYDRGHSAGYDEVASYMNDYYYFAQQIIKSNS